MTKNRISSVIFIGAQRARNRARPCSARQSIFLTEEIIFDFLIDSVAQKLVKLESVENNGKIENFKNFQIFEVFNFSIVFNGF